MNYTVHGIFQAWIMEWVAFSFSRDLPIPGILYQLNHQGSPRTLELLAYSFSSRSSDSGIEPESPALQVYSLLRSADVMSLTDTAYKKRTSKCDGFPLWIIQKIVKINDWRQKRKNSPMQIDERLWCSVMV